MDRLDEQDQSTTEVEMPPLLASPPAVTRQRRRLFTAVASIAALLIFVLLARSIAAYHVAPLGVVAQPTQTPTATPVATGAAAQTAMHSEYNLMSLAMVSANDVWAVGADYNQSAQSSLVSVFMHFDGVSWKRVPTTFAYPMASICMLPSGEGWAVGGNAILHYTGGRWVVDAVDHSGQYEMLNAITMISADEGWAVGETTDAQMPQALILHYLHGKWTRVSIAGSSSPSSLRAISMSSSVDGWIVGSDYSGMESGIALHYSGGQWKRVEVGERGPLYGISALSPDEAWAVGASNPGTGPGFILHYSYGVWRVVPSPTPNILHAITMHSPSDGWIGGDGAAILHFDGTRWARVSPTIHQVGMLSVSVMGYEGWATGSGVMLRLHNGVWAPYTLPAANT